jgi:hypothetical protein
MAALTKTEKQDDKKEVNKLNLEKAEIKVELPIKKEYKKRGRKSILL